MAFRRNMETTMTQSLTQAVLAAIRYADENPRMDADSAIMASLWSYGWDISRIPLLAFDFFDAATVTPTVQGDK
jgi:aspartyl/asparaginyl beta-hydroxylase (cupin superfamily)